MSLLVQISIKYYGKAKMWLKLYNFILDVKPSICKAQHNLIHVIASLAERRNREGGDQLA